MATPIRTSCYEGLPESALTCRNEFDTSLTTAVTLSFGQSTVSLSIRASKQTICADLDCRAAWFVDELTGLGEGSLKVLGHVRKAPNDRSQFATFCCA